jgi:hypothetical protein
MGAISFFNPSKEFSKLYDYFWFEHSSHIDRR